MPQTRPELEAWVHDHLELSADDESGLLQAIDTVFTRHERLWQQSKHEAVRALSAGFADKMAHVAQELQTRDATVRSISAYFEQLVAELTDKSNRDPKTWLMNFRRFTDQLESFLALEQRGQWCAVGLVDIAGFKWYNDTLGHAVGDRIIQRVAALLRDQVRAGDLLAQEPAGTDSRELHARLGGDEFCFLIPELSSPGHARAVAERFRATVERFNWTDEDPGLDRNPVRVDVGVVCLRLGPVSGRRGNARPLAGALLQRADTLMYEAKRAPGHDVRLVRACVRDGELSEPC